MPNEEGGFAAPVEPYAIETSRFCASSSTTKLYFNLVGNFHVSALPLKLPAPHQCLRGLYKRPLFRRAIIQCWYSFEGCGRIYCVESYERLTYYTESEVFDPLLPGWNVRICPPGFQMMYIRH